MVEQIVPELVERISSCLEIVASMKPGARLEDFWEAVDEAKAIVAALPKPVDPDLIEARRIADEHSNRCGVKRNEPYAAGNSDDQVVAAILDGIKLGRTRSLARTDQETAHVR